MSKKKKKQKQKAAGVSAFAQVDEATKKVEKWTLVMKVFLVFWTPFKYFINWYAKLHGIDLPGWF